MTNNIQCSIESSTTKIELNSATEGVFLVPELEGLAGLPEIRTTSGVNAGYDGGWTSAQNYDARLITIRGVIANPDVAQVEAKRRAIASLLGQGRKEQLTLRITTEAGNSYAISVRTISCEMALQRVLTTQEFLIQLRADDPLIYDDGATAGTEAILYVQQALGGFEINFGLPLAIGGGAEDTVVQNGEETVYPILKLYGPLHRPTVVNTTTNQQMQLDADLQYTINWSGYETESGDYITLNDGVANAPLTLTQLLGNAEQATYSGKNLLPSINTTRTRNNVTFTHNDDGSISLSGTASADTAYPINVNSTGNSRNVNLSAGSYIVSGGSATSPTTVYMQAYYGVTGGADQYTTGAFTLSADGTMGAYIYVKSGVNTSGKTIYPMVEAGSTATDYEPYVGGTASPNPDYPQAIETVTGGQTVAITGKNLFGGLTEYYVSYCSYTLANNILTITPADTTHNPGVGFLLGASIPSGTTIHLSSATSIGTATQLRDSSNAVVANFGSGTDTTRTLSGTAERIVFNWQSTGSTTPFTVDLSTLQIEVGSTATSYEPYQGQSYEINLGKNLLGLQDASATQQSGVSISVQNGTISLNGTASASFGVVVANLSEALRMTNGIDYAISMMTASGSASHDFDIQLRDGSDTNIFSINSSYLPASRNTFSGIGKKLRLYIASGTVFNNYKIAFQIERGSTATSFAPYFTPIELAKIGTYQDYIWNDDGTWKIHKEVGKVVLDGTEAGWFWTAAQTRIATLKTNIGDMVQPTTGDTVIQAISTHFTAKTEGQFFATGADGVMCITTGGYFNLRDSLWTSLATAQSWLASNNPTVYYTLATPTDTEITDDTLLAQLNTISELYGGVNHISLVPSAGAQGTMAVSYATESETVQDVAIIDSQARTITINGQDAYHLKTAESEFLLLAPGENKLYLTSEASDDSGYAEVKFKQGYLSI